MTLFVFQNSHKPMADIRAVGIKINLIYHIQHLNYLRKNIRSLLNVSAYKM